MGRKWKERIIEDEKGNRKRVEVRRRDFLKNLKRHAASAKNKEKQR
jgi:hypothetical protein